MSEFGHVVKEGAGEVGKKAWRGTKKVLLFALLIGILVGTGYVVFNYTWTYSKGVSTGNLVKISKKGYLLKTYEGLQDVGGIRANEQGTVISNMWEFSVVDDQVYEQLQALQNNKVKLYYKQTRKAFPWRGNTNYFVYKVEPMPE